MRRFSVPFIASLLTALAAIPSLAQDGEKVEEVQTRISILAIGDAPQPRFEFRDDRRHLLETPAADSPPGEVLVRQKKGKEESFNAVPLGLNSPTGYITYRGERNLVLFREDAAKKRYEFARIALPEMRDDLTLLLLRNRTSKSWEKEPRVYYFDNGLGAFPNDSVRVINLSAVTVRARINEGTTFDLAAGGHKIIGIPRKDQGILSYRVAAVAEEKIFPLVDTATTTMPDTRFNLIVYATDSGNPRTPVDIASYFERPPQKDVEGEAR
ncbi:MAG: hypothetical protein ACKO2G_08050 [Verrucomicrobiales bacterium]